MKPRDLWDLRDRWEQEPATGGARANGKAAAPGTRYSGCFLFLRGYLPFSRYVLLSCDFPS